jgi:phosphatidylglycerophosphatase A
MKDSFVVLVLTFFYTGKTPKIPGTIGSLAGLLLFWALDGHPFVRGGVFAAFALCGVCLGARAEKIFRAKDPRPVVIDEVVGIFPAFILLPPDMVIISIGFVVYRFLDIFKPFPMRRLERLPAGWGIMADDVAGGILTAALMQLAFILSNILR